MTATPPGTRRERADKIKTEFDRKERRRRLAFYGAVGVVVAVLIAVGAVGIRNVSQNKDAQANTNLQSSSGLGAESAPPWALPADAASRVKAAGLTLGQMGTAEHYHAHLDILVDGQPVPIPVNIGIDSGSGAMSAVHTHSNDGLIHVEAATTGQPFTLGQLFTEWNVRLSENQAGSLTAGKGNALTAYVDGKKVAGNPAMIRLAGRQQIALVYGPKDAKVNVPDTFKFEKGL